MKEKILKIKIGEVWDEDKKVSKPVYQTAWKKKRKNGDPYYGIELQIYVNEIEKKENGNNKKRNTEL